MDAGANVELQDDRGRTAMHHLAVDSTCGQCTTIPPAAGAAAAPHLYMCLVGRADVWSHVAAVADKELVALLVGHGPDLLNVQVRRVPDSPCPDTATGVSTVRLLPPTSGLHAAALLHFHMSTHARPRTNTSAHPHMASHRDCRRSISMG